MTESESATTASSIVAFAANTCTLIDTVQPPPPPDISPRASGLHQHRARDQQRGRPVSARYAEWAVDDGGLAGKSGGSDRFLVNFCMVHQRPPSPVPLRIPPIFLPLGSGVSMAWSIVVVVVVVVVVVFLLLLLLLLLRCAV